MLKIKDKVSALGTVRDITERKKAELALKESERQYRLLFNLLPYGGEVIDTKGFIIKCSPRTGEMLGYNVSELLGKHITNFIDKDGKGIFKQNFPKILSGKSASLEICMLKKDGSKINVLRAVQPVMDKDGKVESVLALNLDITERIEAEKEIKMLSTLVTQSPTIITITDLQGNLEYVNRKFIEVTGYTHKDAIGQNPRILKSDKHPPSFYKGLWATISSGKEWKGEIYNKKKNGEFYWELANIFPIFNQEGIISNYIKESQDITLRKETEQLLQNQTQELKKQNEDLDAFSHTVAHDLKNPMAVIAGFANLLQTEYTSLNEKEIQTYIELIIKSGSKAQEIIKGLLLLANVRKSNIKTKELKMHYIVSEAIKRLSFIKTQKDAQIKLPKIWPKVLGNAIWVEEIWVNFINNAIKYGGESPFIEIGADSNKTGFTENGMAYFWIKDHGDGISEENQKMLFQKFERFEQVKTEGHGLGLSIVRNIVEKLGGQVGVESSLGKGSLFYFTLPLKSYTNH